MYNIFKKYNAIYLSEPSNLDYCHIHKLNAVISLHFNYQKILQFLEPLVNAKKV